MAVMNERYAELFIGGVPMNTATETECVNEPCSTSLTVIDVFNALHANYAFISGKPIDIFQSLSLLQYCQLFCIHLHTGTTILSLLLVTLLQVGPILGP